MIEYIKGEIVELAPARMVLECAGIGYELNISLNTYSFFNGKREGKIYVYEVIREDAHLLFGFAEKVERELFLLLTSVSGVGPNTARMILSSLPPSDLIRVIAEKNETALTSVKGIGLKTAQRILVDLKSKVKNMEGATVESKEIVSSALAGNQHVVVDEAVAALVMLGFQKAASQKVVHTILKGSPALTVEQVIKTALRML
ncbi:MAG: Holliday junction branch migration protein RuvA [Parabacteroides distasonis]|nr:Holliday junction branch migration protein RuvA [Parabacteroides distasonis]MBR2497955.1 Holliday junction branch migration protein RuvA [Parabacteroides sp.]